MNTLLIAAALLLKLPYLCVKIVCLSIFSILRGADVFPVLQLNLSLMYEVILGLGKALFVFITTIVASIIAISDKETIDYFFKTIYSNTMPIVSCCLGVVFIYLWGKLLMRIVRYTFSFCYSSSKSSVDEMKESPKNEKPKVIVMQENTCTSSIQKMISLLPKLSQKKERINYYRNALDKIVTEMSKDCNDLREFNEI